MHPARKKLRRAYLGLGVFVLVLVGLVAASIRQPESPDAAEVARILGEVDAEQTARADALIAARARLPAGAPFTRDWDFAGLQAQCRRGLERPLIMVMDAYLDQGDLSDRFDRMLHRFYGRGPIVCGEGAFHGVLEVGDRSPERLRPQLAAYIRGLDVLDEIRYGLRHGLCDGLPATIWDPKQSNLLGLAYYFSARAVAETEAGNTADALDYFVDGLLLADLFLAWPLTKGHEQWAFARRVTLRGLWRIMDLVVLDADQRARLEKAMDTTQAATRLRTVIRYHAAISEADREAGHYGMPRLAALAAGRTGRGSMASGKQLLAILETPPPASNDALRVFRHATNGHYWYDRFREQSTYSVWLAARETLSVDVFQIACRLKAHRAAHGRYPDSLDALLPPAALPRDPASGALFVYDRSGDGFTLAAPGCEAVHHEFFWVARQ